MTSARFSMSTVSPAWHVSYADLEPYYIRAERLYQVHGVRGVDPSDPPSPTQYPPADQPRAPRRATARRPGRGGVHPFELPNGILLDETAPHRSACVRCSTCDGFPCLVNGKADAQTICVEPALEQPNVTLLTDAYISRLETGPSGRFVERVVVQRDGRREEYRADIVVLAAGAINSAAVLLRSASPRHPHRLGSSSGVVGRHLMMHNNSSLIAFWPRRDSRTITGFGAVAHVGLTDDRACGRRYGSITQTPPSHHRGRRDPGAGRLSSSFLNVAIQCRLSSVSGTSSASRYS